MRPVRLEINGFASFRADTLIEFTDTDFFALVGPTGSGKSTVIDAMVFALYGSAPRWEARNAVRFALAPTTNRATVRLVFDVGAQRYAVARELRRGTQGVNQRTVSLERYDDPQAGGNPEDDEQTETLAADIRAVNAEIEALLGLNFDDFCKCVVLPQGQFSDFLKATPGERQQILFKLLGARHYELIREQAGVRSSEAGQRLNVLEAQLEPLLGATPERVAQTADRLAALEQLDAATAQRAEQVAQLREISADSTRARQDCETARQQLSQVEVPSDLVECQQAAAPAAAARRAAQQAEVLAQQAYDDARTALEQAGARRDLDELATAWRELAEVEAVLPELSQRVADEEEAGEARTQETAAASAAVEQARAAGAAVSAQVEQAVRTLDDVTAQLRQLENVRQPEGVADLAAQIDGAHAAREAAERAVTTADDAVETARQEGAALPDLGALTTARDLLTDRDAQQQRLAEQAQRIKNAESVEQQAAMLLADAERAVTEASSTREAAVEAELAAELRDGLTVGEPCPVCAQTVYDLPDPHAPAETAADGPPSGKQQATAALRAAEDAAKQARVGHNTAGATLATARAAHDATTSQLETIGARLRDLSAEHFQVAGVQASIEQVQEHRERLEAAEQSARAARLTVRTAGETVQGLAADQAEAGRLLHEARLPLLTFGAPTDPDTDLGAGWRRLVDWAATRAAELRTDELPAATAAADAVRNELAAAEDEFAAAQRDATEARRNQQQAVAELASARTTLTQAQERQRSLTERLAGQPSAEQVTEALAAVAAAESAERAAYQAVTSARQDTAVAVAAENGAATALQEARAALGQTRDRLIGYDPPELPDDLAAGWQRLLDWAAREAASYGARLPGLIEAETAAEAQVTEALAELRAALLAEGIPVAADVDSDTARRQLAGVIRDASRDRDQAMQDLQRRQNLDREAQDARQQRDVAGLLAEHLRANRFQRWLAGAALETLVQGASQSLRELSGGQFDLTHEAGDFLIIDHADAESTRSVRTLSGGETFQASLALALALSEQLSSLTSTGAAPLESIFLDEGFGTLDPDSLDVVAATLDKLAQGDRMVGIVTHVRELAERVPVRYQVRRDQTSSTVRRESA